MVNSKQGSKPSPVQTRRVFRLAQGHTDGSLTRLRPAQGLILVGSAGLMAGGMAMAEESIPEVAEPSPVESPSRPDNPHISGSPRLASPVLAAPAMAQPRFSPPSTAALTQTSPPHVSQPMQPPVPPPNAAAIVIPEPAAAPTMAESLLTPAPDPGATVGTPNPSPGTPSAADLAVPGQIAADESVPAGYNSVFIDPTTYDVGATSPPAAPSVVFSERSTGCQITVSGRQTASSCGDSPTAIPGSGIATTPGGALTASGPAVGGSRLPTGPVTVSPRGVNLGTTVISRAALNDRIRPLNILRRGNEEFVFPLSIPSPISSVFGWRMHPIHQTWRFHSGTDLAAPTGTPVLATQAGRVAVANALGGYGLTVILRHGDGNLESRYAHLSQISVQSGEWIEQGEVIGLVGSTGTSTGPHLHFEVRQLTGEGWVAMDPGEVLEYGIANLMNIINNPMVALGQTKADAAEGNAADSPETPVDYPYRPAQPNAS